MRWSINRDTTTGTELVCQVSSVTYTGERMGDEYVYTSIESPNPIKFKIGDKIQYRGETWRLQALPQVRKVARKGSYGLAFKYDNIKFWAESYILRQLEMKDVVIGDNGIVTLLPNFSFYAETVCDLADRIYANLHQVDIDWSVKVKLVDASVPYYVCGGNVGGNERSKAIGEKNISISINSQRIWDVMQSFISKDFAVSFTVRGKEIVIGSEGYDFKSYFDKSELKYGLGLGCNEIEAVPDAEPSQIITRLRAYGNSTNMPTRYYQRDFLGGYAVYNILTNINKADNELTSAFDYWSTDSFLANSKLVLNAYPSARAEIQKFIVEEIGKGNLYEEAKVGIFPNLNGSYFTSTENIKTLRISTKTENSAYVTMNIKVVTHPSVPYALFFVTTASEVRFYDGMYFTFNSSDVNSSKWMSDINIVVGKIFYNETRLDGYYTEVNSHFLYSSIDSIENFSETLLNKYYKDKESEVVALIKSNSANLPSSGIVFYVKGLRNGSFYDNENTIKSVGITINGTHINVKVFANSTYTSPLFFIPQANYSLVSPLLENGGKFDVDKDCINVNGWVSSWLTIVDEECPIPENFNVTNLMLPNFPTESVYDAKGNTGDSTNALDPYIESENIGIYGLYESSVIFDGSVDGYDDIYPTIKNVIKQNIANTEFPLNGFANTDRIDIVVNAEQIEDNGIYDLTDNATVKQSKFYVWIPQAFDLPELIKSTVDTPQICFNTGTCGGRTFEIVSTPVKHNWLGKDCWKVGLKRVCDNDLNRYFPYYGMNIAQGDEFVLLGVPMPNALVEAAQDKLYEQARAYLADHDYIVSTFSLNVDSVYMQRQHDKCSEYNQVSLHDNLKAGDRLYFSDEDIDGAYLTYDEDDGTKFYGRKEYIERIEISEFDGERLPKYSITLRESKRLSKWQLVQSNQARSISTSTIANSIETINQSVSMNAQKAATRGFVVEKIENLVSEMALEGGGESGGGDKTLIINHDVAEAEWKITHNLGKYPSVTVVSSSNVEVIGDVTYDDENSLKISFAYAFRGKVILN